VHDWEVDSISSLFNVLYYPRVVREGDDSLCWMPSKRSFNVKQFYKVLLPNGVSSFPWKSVWRSKSLLKLAFFLWTTFLEKILSLDNPRKRHIIVINLCCMCKKSRETPDHLFHHFDDTREPWIMGFQMFG
jgi:hypothetical protein